MLKKIVLFGIGILLFATSTFAADTFREVTVVNKIEVLENGVIQVRQAVRVLKNDVPISQTFQRYILEPGQDLAGQDARVAAQAKAAWTDEVVKAWKEFKAAQKK